MIDTESPEFIATVADKMKLLGFNACDHHTGGGVVCVNIETIDGMTFCAGSADVVWGMDVTDSDGEHVEDANLTTTLDSNEQDPEKVARALAVEILAYEFYQNLTLELTTSKIDEIKRRNVSHQKDGVCASHDFCDANMTMYKAFETFGLKNPIDYESDSPEQLKAFDLWNEAWDRAKTVYLTAPESTKAPEPQAMTAKQIHMIETIQKADDAFWEVVAAAYPTAKSGDLSPGMTHRFSLVAAEAVGEWVDNNVPAAN